MAGLPMAQTIWYIPTGLDIWNQKINKAPGHYARSGSPSKAHPSSPSCTGPTRRPSTSRARPRQARSLADAGASRPRAGGLSRVPRHHGGQAAPQGGAGAAGVRGPDRPAGSRLPQSLLHHRPQVVPCARHRGARQLRSAGTTPSTSSTRARSTSASARAGIRPTRWPATALRTISSSRRSRPFPTPAPPRKQAGAAAQYGAAVASGGGGIPGCRAAAATSPPISRHLSKLLLAGKGPRQILDVLQIGAAQVLLETQDTLNFSIPQHCYEYLQHARLVLRHLRASAAAEAALCRRLVLNRNAWHQRQHRRQRREVEGRPSRAAPKP